MNVSLVQVWASRRVAASADLSRSIRRIDSKSESVPLN
jgi:hypothetical protein